MARAAKTPLTSRPLDLFYFIFFLMHLPASILVNCQTICPPEFIPSFIKEFVGNHIQSSGDPLIGGVLGYNGDVRNFVWLKTNLFVEIFFQVPVFILGMRGLWNDSSCIHLLLLIYGASTTTATLPCLAVLLSTPITSAQTVAAGIQSITESQRLMLLSSYLPFFILPLVITVDMTFRVAKLMRKGEMAAGTKKSQ